MALIFRTLTESGHLSVKHGFDWDSWYQKNRERLSKKRAQRYREDPSYRAAALERSRRQRETVKKPTTPNPAPYTVPFLEAADELGVTVWVLREWRRKNYFPEPYHREGRLWFTPHQVHLLHELKQVFDTHGTRVTDAFRPKVENVVSLTYSNWN